MYSTILRVGKVSRSIPKGPMMKIPASNFFLFKSKPKSKSKAKSKAKSMSKKLS